MIGFKNFNERIIANSASRTPCNLNEEKTVVSAKKLHDEKTVNKYSYVKYGSAAIAGIVTGILLTKNCKNLVKLYNNLAGSYKHKKYSFTGGILDEPVQVRDFDVDIRDKEIFQSEALKERLAGKFSKITDIVQDTVGRQQERLEQLLNSSDKTIPFDDRRLFTSHESKMIYAHLENDVLNELLKLNKINPENNIELRTLNEVISEAKPLKENAVVYKGILTQTNGKTLDIERQLYAGNIIKDNGFVLTSRNAAETIRGMGEQSGYVMKIYLPTGTRGIDCRRFTALDLDTGNNGTFILPSGSQFRIIAVDDNFKLIKADYI